MQLLTKYKILLMILILVEASFAQWEVGGSYSRRSEVPENGFGICVSRNLPFQWATIGFKVRAGVDLFRSTEAAKKFLSEDYYVDLIGTFFFRNVNPYFGLRTGLGHQHINKFDENIFFLGVIAGMKFPLTELLHPYLEITSAKYFSSFDENLIERDISSFQIKGAVGLIFKFDSVQRNQ